MMRPAWLDERAPSLARSAALAPLTALSWCYGAGAALHRAWYERGYGERARLPCRVISVGNLVVGGSGKTPLAAWIAAQLHARGRRVALASRGAGGKPAADVHVVSDGARILESAAVAGEEALLLARLAPGVPVLVARRRELAGLRAIAQFGCDVLVLDDAFQHHRLARDVDLVLFSSAGLGSGGVLPRGPLREPLSALSRADAVLVTGGALPPEDEARVAAAAPQAARFGVLRAPSALCSLASGAAEPPASLAGREVGALSGLANPRALRETLASLGARLVAERTFPDHHRYAPGDLSGLAQEAALWVTTEKDAIKLVPSWAKDVDVRVLTLRTEVAEPARFLAWVSSRVAT